MRMLSLFLSLAWLLVGQSSQSREGVHQASDKDHEAKQSPAYSGPAAASVPNSLRNPAAPQNKQSEPNRTSQYTWRDYLREAFGAAYLSNWLLAIFALIAAIVALRTLRSIERQTVAIVESQRPKFTLVPHPDSMQRLWDREAPRVLIKLSNVGLTSARNLVYETWMEIVSAPFVDFSSAAEYSKVSTPLTLRPSESPIVVNIPIKPIPTADEWSALVSHEREVCFRVCVTFADAFAPRRQVNFGFVVQPQGFAFLPKYNDED
jgi:hypothetical protein